MIVDATLLYATFLYATLLYATLLYVTLILYLHAISLRDTSLSVLSARYSSSLYRICRASNGGAHYAPEPLRSRTDGVTSELVTRV